METVAVVLLVAAIVLFVLDGFAVNKPGIVWTPLAWACVVAASLAAYVEVTAVLP